MDALTAVPPQISTDRDSEHLDEAFAILRGQNTKQPERKHLAAMAEQMVCLERQMAQLREQIEFAAATARSVISASALCEQIGAKVRA